MSYHALHCNWMQISIFQSCLPQRAWLVLRKPVRQGVHVGHPGRVGHAGQLLHLHLLLLLHCHRDDLKLIVLHKDVNPENQLQLKGLQIFNLNHPTVPCCKIVEGTNPKIHRNASNASQLIPFLESCFILTYNYFWIDGFPLDDCICPSPKSSLISKSAWYIF